MLSSFFQWHYCLIVAMLNNHCPLEVHCSLGSLHNIVIASVPFYRGRKYMPDLPCAIYNTQNKWGFLWGQKQFLYCMSNIRKNKFSLEQKTVYYFLFYPFCPTHLLRENNRCRGLYYKSVKCHWGDLMEK